VDPVTFGIAQRMARRRILAQLGLKVMRALALLAMVLLLPRFALAEGLDYRVQINAPGKLDKLLDENLDLVRFRGNPRVDRDQLQRLVRAAPEQIKTLVATEGFYSPLINVTMNDGAEPVVHVDVQPGEPTLVGDVDIVLEGFESTSKKPFDKEALKAAWLL